MSHQTDLEQQIRQISARLQSLQAQADRQQASADQNASRKAREIISRAEAEADTIRKGAQKERAQISRNECAAVVRERQQIQREIEALKQERATIAKEMNELHGRLQKPIDQVLPAASPALAKTSEEQFREALLGKPKKKRWKTVLIAIVIIALLGVLAFELLLGVTKMRDEAMGTSVPEGSQILYSRLSKMPHTNELAVFENKAGLLCVRRAIARGGDTVDYDELSNQIFVNNKAIPNVPEDVNWRGVENVFEFPITVQDGEVFVLAGNRSKATNEGLIKTDQIKGTVLKIF